eukprot:Opistho-2@8212
MALPQIVLRDGTRLHVVDMFASFDEALLSQFYHNIMKPNFPIADELDAFETWVESLDPALKHLADPLDPHFHVLLALDCPETSSKDMASVEKGSVTEPLFDARTCVVKGGLVCEYYPGSCCALASYAVVADSVRGKGIQRHLFDQALKILGNYETGCDLFLAETNCIGVDDGVMESATRHTALHRLGFRGLDFAYAQPPLKEGTDWVKDLVLLVHHTTIGSAVVDGESVRLWVRVIGCTKIRLIAHGK